MVEAQKSRENDGIKAVQSSMKDNKTLLHTQGHRDVPGGIEPQVFVQNSSLRISTEDGYIKGHGASSILVSVNTAWYWSTHNF